MTSPTNEQQRVVGWYCERDGKTVLTSGFVAENRAYVEAQKDCNWRPLLHPDAVAELIEKSDALVKAGKRLRNTVVQTRGVKGMDDHDAALREAEATLANVGAQK